MAALGTIEEGTEMVEMRVREGRGGEEIKEGLSTTQCCKTICCSRS